MNDVVTYEEDIDENMEEVKGNDNTFTNIRKYNNSVKEL